jgi:hypothetical protein
MTDKTNTSDIEDRAFAAGMAFAYRLISLKAELADLADGNDYHTAHLAYTLNEVVRALEDRGCLAVLDVAASSWVQWREERATEAAEEQRATSEARWVQHQGAWRRAAELAVAGFECPYCHATPGQPCVTAGGNPMATGGNYPDVHADRRRAGERAYEAERREGLAQ